MDKGSWLLSEYPGTGVLGNLSGLGVFSEEIK
jgi:hypothetical protein